MSTAHVTDLTAGYLLGALEPDEHEAVRAHVSSCDACAASLRDTRDVLAVLPDSLDEIDELAPRPAVRTSLLAQARAEGGIGATLTRPQNVREFAPRSDAQARGASWFQRYGGYAVAAAILLAVAGGMGAWVAVLNDRVGDRDAQLAASRDLIDAITVSQAVLTMEGTEAAPNVHAALVVDQASVVVLASNVPQPEPGTGYHLWLFDGDTPVYGGLLVPDNAGVVKTAVQVDLRLFDRMEVDVQPLDATAPGGVTVVGGELSVN